MYGTLNLSLSFPSTTSKPLSFPPESRFSRRTSRFPAKATVRAFTGSATADAVDSRCVKHGAESLYEVLRVKRNATATEIKSAYRSLAKMYHPDLSGPEKSDGSDFMVIHNAYATLSDPAARAVYDLSIGGVGSMMNRRMMRSDFGFYPTRRWETDQCW